MPDIFDQVDEIKNEKSAALLGDEDKSTYFSRDIFDEVDRVKSDSLSSRMASIRRPPEQAAKNYALSDETGLPAEYIDRNPESVVKPFNFDALRKKAPVLAGMLEEKRNAEVAQDDLDNLSWYEEAAREAKNIAKIVPAAAFSTSGAIYATLGAAQRALELIPQAPIALAAKTLDILGYKDAAKRKWLYYEDLNTASGMLFDLAKSETEQSKEWIAKPDETSLHPAILGGVQSAITNIPAIAASVITRNPNIGLYLMGGQSFGSSVIDGREKGLGDFESMIYGFNNMGAEIITEKIPLIKLLGDIEKNTGFAKMLGKQMVAEGVTEQIATVWQDANAWAALNPSKTLSEFMDERGEAAYNTLISTVVATGLQTSVVAGVSKLADSREVVDQIEVKAKESKYRELDKANFESFLQEVAEENDSIDHLYIDAESAREAITQMDDQDAAYQLLAEQIDEAESLNGDIAIPVGEYASTIVPSSNYQFIKDSVRVEPDSNSVTLNAFERIQEAYKSIDKKDESKRIFEEVRDQLKDTGKLTPEQARLSAEIIPAFLGANPERMGLTVEQAYEMMGLKIIGPQEEIGDQKIIGIIDSLKSGEDTKQTQELSSLLEAHNIDVTQESKEIVKQLTDIKEFKQKPTIDNVTISDPLLDTTEWRDATVTATLDDGSTQEMNAGSAYDIINTRRENALKMLGCLNVRS